MNANILIENEKPFQVNKRAFMLSESSSGYTLYCSVNCNSEDDPNATWAEFSGAIPSGKQHLVTNVAASCWWKCVGNNGYMYARF